MKKNILIYGLIAGVIVSTIMLFIVNYISHCEGSVDYNTSMLLGYASMLVAFSLVFIGIRNYRDKYNGGVIRFGKAFKIGLMMTLIASTVYVAAWLVNYYFFNPDFFERYTAQEIANLKASGATQTKIDEETTEMTNMVKNLKNPIFHAAMTYLEILPVGLIVTLISALVLKKKPANN
ncbi:MAG TPA: DUF4199 domain-containing protein [Chitinophagaceae bacterium]|jgi:amino acid transporter|nr:DUF4199 domain-containing protein [Chitinophagaceae bacterium]